MIMSNGRKKRKIAFRILQNQKKEFLKDVNYGRYPKYLIGQVKTGVPRHDCSTIVRTRSGGTYLASYFGEKWQQARFTSTEYGPQQMYFEDIREEVVFWMDGEAQDYSRKQFEE